MGNATANLQEKLRIIIPKIVDAWPGIDSEEIAELLGVSDKAASDAVAELCADGVLAPDEGDSNE